MGLVKVRCAFCKKEYFRERGRFNEAKKFDWKQYCSKKCQNKAKITRIKKICGNPDCSKPTSRILNQFKRSKSKLIFCSQGCAAIVNNKQCPKRKAKTEICVNCKKIFKKGGRKNPKYCSIECQQEAKWYTPEEIIEIIRNTAQKLGRVPSRRELNNIGKPCRKFFGSWNNAVLAAGLTPNRSHDNRMYKRSNIKALDGHLCDSVSESLIDNWLYKNNIRHRKNVRYPETNHKADWEIVSKSQKIFIEYFGLANDSPRYDRSVKQKKKLCRKHKIKLIAIYHWDLYPKGKFEKKLKKELKSSSGCSWS